MMKEKEVVENIYATDDVVIKCECTLRNSKPTDKVIIKTDEEYASILEYGQKVSTKKVGDALADIVLADTVPVKDIIIDIGTATIRVLKDGETVLIDATTNKNDEYRRIMRLESIIIDDVPCMCTTAYYFKRDSEVVMSSDLAAFDESEESKAFYTEQLDNSLMAGYQAYVLWYCIQLCLLNPLVKTVMKSKGSDPIDIKTRKAGKNKKGKRVIKYVKRHEIDINELKAFNQSRIYRRSMTLWHVTGHYREYKDGHKIFIKPYWKGADRDKLNDAETVERKIVTD